MTPLSNLGRRTRSLLGDTLELLAMALDRSQRTICNEYQLSQLGWRTYGTRLLSDLRKANFKLESLQEFVKAEFCHKISSGRSSLLEVELKLIRAHLSTNNQADVQELDASIRKAKGLQADAVLVVAKGLSELKKWLCTDRATRASDRQDKCRLGYVAFTRGREMLCIACRKPIDDELTRMFDRLGITVAPHSAVRQPN